MTAPAKSQAGGGTSSELRFIEAGADELAGGGEGLFHFAPEAIELDQERQHVIGVFGEMAAQLGPSRPASCLESEMKVS